MTITVHDSQLPLFQSTSEDLLWIQRGCQNFKAIMTESCKGAQLLLLSMASDDGDSGIPFEGWWGEKGNTINGGS